MKRVLVLLLLVLLLVSGYFWLSKSEPTLQKLGEVTSETTEEAKSAPTPAPPVVLASEVPTTSSVLLESSLSKIKFPDLKIIRTQVADDPHSPPPALIELAEELSPHMAAALEDAGYAHKFFDFLQECAMGPQAQEYPSSVRAYCASNAGTLAQKHGGALAELYEKLRKSLPKNISSILRALDES